MAMASVPDFVYRLDDNYRDNGDAMFQQHNRELTPFDVAPYNVECQ